MNFPYYVDERDKNILILNSMLQDVNQVLYKHKVSGISYNDILGRGRSHHEAREVNSYEGYRTGEKETVEFESRTKVETVVPESTTKEVIDDVFRTIGSGPAPDGKVLAEDISEAYGVRSNESSESALELRYPVKTNRHKHRKNANEADKNMDRIMFAHY
jgi:nitrogen regulatory protein P-II 1